MQQAHTALPLRNDTLLGVCEALGQDFGINPQILRIAFALAMVWQPLWVVAGYFAAGLVVLVSRLVFPDRSARAEAPAAVVDAPAANEALPELAQAA